MGLLLVNACGLALEGVVGVPGTGARGIITVSRSKLLLVISVSGAEVGVLCPGLGVACCVSDLLGCTKQDSPTFG